MKVPILSFLSVFFASSVYAQDANYNTVTTTSTDSNSPVSIRILGQNDPVGETSVRKISFDFSAAGKAQIQAYRNNSMGTTLQFLTNDDGDPLGGSPSIRMQISRNGHVGIGTTAPASRLSVFHESGYGKVASFSSALGDEQVGIGAESNGFSWVGTTSNHNFQIYANNDAKMSVLANGNVGIGTAMPNSKLAVNGNIRAHEIKVETANWPDYVFAKDYELPTLQETEKHIKDKGHLPGIPSAAEVKANGIDLGEMNAKLLQKIEELTLHLINENKENTETKKKLRACEEKIKALTELILPSTHSN
ncbi:hypothetical protein [Pedobacter africanus]|uniref:Uncharacterized protein n=1 Tax=Pedobacter africanus TaxID=151894 RepID=A0A1W2BR35_9SPHI|nr:hypothetical protein [Pedobacter africanus]SMC75341.1 hypothetical protein SAMN04488524_2569 [Pedobacter africanus]